MDEKNKTLLDEKVFFSASDSRTRVIFHRIPSETSRRWWWWRIEHLCARVRVCVCVYVYIKFPSISHDITFAYSVEIQFRVCYANTNLWLNRADTTKKFPICLAKLILGKFTQYFRRGKRKRIFTTKKKANYTRINLTRLNWFLVR